MQELKKVIWESYFSLIFMMITQIIAVLISIRNRKKFTELKYFHFYPIAALSQTIISFAAIVFLDDQKNRIIYPSISIFVLIEFILIYLFIFRINPIQR